MRSIECFALASSVASDTWIKTTGKTLDRVFMWNQPAEYLYALSASWSINWLPVKKRRKRGAVARTSCVAQQATSSHFHCRQCTLLSTDVSRKKKKKKKNGGEIVCLASISTILFHHPGRWRHDSNGTFMSTTFVLACLLARDRNKLLWMRLPR